MWVLIDPVMWQFNKNATLAGSCSVVEMRGWLSFAFKLERGLRKLELKLRLGLG